MGCGLYSLDFAAGDDVGPTCIVLFAITWVFSLIAVFFIQEKDAIEAK